MGDRGNIIVEDDGKIYLYTHYSGSDLPQIVARGLERGKNRWDDGPYLTRILFCELLPQDEWNGEIGYGISTYLGDGGTEVTVDVKNRIVQDDDGEFTFAEYAARFK